MGYLFPKKGIPFAKSLLFWDTFSQKKGYLLGIPFEKRYNFPLHKKKLLKTPYFDFLHKKKLLKTLYFGFPQFQRTGFAGEINQKKDSE